MKVIKPSALHTVFARHSTRTTKDGKPVFRWFTQTQWKLMGVANLGDGNYQEKQGWILSSPDAVNPPPEAVKPFEVKPQVVKQEPTEAKVDDVEDSLRDGLGHTLTIRQLHGFVKANKDGLDAYLDEGGKSSSGALRMPKKDLVELLHAYLKEN